MASSFHIQETSRNIQKSFIDYQSETLPKYTLEEVKETLEKGEKDLFFTKGQLVELRESLQKGDVENIDEINSQLKNLEPFMLQKSEDDQEVGYFIKFEK